MNLKAVSLHSVIRRRELPDELFLPLLDMVVMSKETEIWFDERVPNAWTKHSAGFTRGSSVLRCGSERLLKFFVSFLCFGPVNEIRAGERRNPRKQTPAADYRCQQNTLIHI